MRNVLKGFLLFFCSFPFFSAAAQSTAASATLVVRVQDSAGSPIPGATISVIEASEARPQRDQRGEIGTAPVPGELVRGKSDANGQAAFRGLPISVLSVVASAKGFYANEARRVELTTGTETMLTIDLQARQVVSESVVVTGSGTESLIQEAPIRTELITHEVVDRPTSICRILGTTTSEIWTKDQTVIRLMSLGRSKCDVQ